MNVLCFFGQNNQNGFLSSFYPAAFTVEGIASASLEQYMMYSKAACFNDHEAAEKILQTSDPVRIKKIGRKVQNFDESLWNGIRQIVVYNGLPAKFSQNPDLCEKLLATGDALLAEASPYDRIWGTGIPADDPDVQDPSKWKGKNLLGYTLMMVQKDLAAGKKH